jgi:hypothetical protein
VAGGLAFSKEVWYYRTFSIKERSEIDDKWEIPVFLRIFLESKWLIFH